MKKALIIILSIIALSSGIYAGMIYFADHLPAKQVAVDDRPAAMKMIDDYYGGDLSCIIKNHHSQPKKK
jgi:hypothetical protein